MPVVVSGLADLAIDPKAVHVATQWKHGRPIISCRFDPTGEYLFACSEDNLIVRWEVATGKKVVMPGHETWARGIAFSNDGKTVVTSGYDDRLIWWNARDEQPKPVRTVVAHDGWIRSIAVSPDGKWLVSGANDRLLKLWDMQEGKLIRQFSGHESHVYSTLFHPDGQHLLSGDLKGQVKQWEISSGKLIRTFDGKALHTYNGGQGVDYGGVRSMSLSPDKKFLACAGLHKATNPLGAVNEPLVIIFDWTSQKLVKSLIGTGIKGIAWRAMYHPNGFLVGVSGGSGGGFLVFWKPDQEKEFHKLKLPDTIREMDLHPDGIQVATAHFDGHVRICKLAPKAT